MNLRFVMIQDFDMWVAQCVEYDFAAQGRTPAECRKNMADQVMAEIDCSLDSTGELFGGIPASPKSVKEQWDIAENEFQMSATITHEKNDPMAFKYRLVG